MTGDNNDINPRLQLLSAYNIDPLPKDFHDEITLASSSPSRNFTLRSWSKKLNASTVIREYKAKAYNRKPKKKPSSEFFRDDSYSKPLNLYRKEEIASNILKTGIIKPLDEDSVVADPYNVHNIARKNIQNQLETRFQLREPNNIILSSNAAGIFMKTDDNYYNYHKNNNQRNSNNNQYNIDPNYQYYNIENNNIVNGIIDNDNNNKNNYNNNKNDDNYKKNNINVNLPGVKRQASSRATTPYTNTKTNTKTNTLTNTNTKTDINNNTNQNDITNNTAIMTASKAAMIKLREEHERKKMNEIQAKKSTVEIKKKINQFRKTIHQKLKDKNDSLANDFLRFFNEKMASALMEKYKGCSMNIDAFLALLGRHLGDSARPISSNPEIMKVLYESRLEDFIREMNYQEQVITRKGLNTRDGLVHAAGFRTPINNTRDHNEHDLDDVSVDSLGSHNFYNHEYASQNANAIRTSERASTAIGAFQRQLITEGVWPPKPVEIVIGASELDHLKGARGPQRIAKVDQVMEKLFYDQRMRNRVLERRRSQGDMSQEQKAWAESLQSPTKDIKSLLELPVGATYVPPVTFPRILKTVDKGVGLDYPAPSPYRSHPGTIPETSLIMSGGVGSGAGMSLWSGPRQMSKGWLRQIEREKENN